MKFSQASVYADDSNITIESDDFEKLIFEVQQELINLSEWMRITKLSPNPAKTEYMIIGHSRKVNTLNISNALTLNDSVIKGVTKTKSLGVIVDDNLKWDETIVENARYKDNWSCDWLSVDNIIRFDRSVMTYKVRNKLSPECLWDKFQERSSQSNGAKRHCRDLQIPRLNTEHAKIVFNILLFKCGTTFQLLLENSRLLVALRKN